MGEIRRNIMYDILSGRGGSKVYNVLYVQHLIKVICYIFKVGDQSSIYLHCQI